MIAPAKPMPNAGQRLMGRLASAARSAFNGLGGYFPGTIGGGYDAIDSKNRRKPTNGKLISADAELLPEQRRRLLSASRDIRRNFSIARWAINKHLDYVSTFTLQPKCANQALNDKLAALMTHWSKPQNFDIAGRHGLRRFIRMAEACRTVDGDMGVLKLLNGQVQAIEGDRIRSLTGTVSPTGRTAPDARYWGVETDPYGKALRYSVCKRIGWQGAFEFERMIDADNLFLFGYFDRFDQTRGISPVASGLNSFRDTYEGIDYALAKLKVAQLFGLKITSKNPEGIEISGREEGEDEDGERGERYDVNPALGPFKLELEPDEDADFMESHTPSTETQAFLQVVIGAAIKSIDLPYSFYAENFSNYSGSRQALLMYEQSAKVKREDVRELEDHLTAWRVVRWWLEGEFGRASLNDIGWLWIPAGLPWIDPEAETNAEIAQVNGGLDNPIDICRRHGGNFFHNIDQIAAANKYAADNGVQLSYVNYATQTKPKQAPEPTHGQQQVA